MPLTYTGRLVEAEGEEYPSLVDIAVGLSRQPRFAGQTRRWWSVLDHTLFCDELVKDIVKPPFDLHTVRLWRLAVLLHDAHEALTADVPTTLKPKALKDIQGRLDIRIMDAYFPGGSGSYGGWHLDVKAIDRRALMAEAHIVGPPMTYERTVELFGADGLHTSEDRDLLENLLAGSEAFGWPPHPGGQEHHPAVREYLRRVLEVM